MDFSAIKDLYIGSTPVQQAWLNGMQVYPSAKRITDSLVCWYDIGKQQCTNESMAAKPVLTDLSGNGHDITCYNFAWSGMSGIGGYVYNLIGTKYSTVSNNIATIISNEDAKGGTIITEIKRIMGEKGKTLTHIRKAFDIKISNLPNGIDIQVNLEKNNGNTSEWEHVGYFVNGINHVDEEVITVEPYDSESIPYINDCRILFSKKLASVENIADLGITIELLPEYPNALVSDGVDDYCYTTGLPILTDYTVIAKRKWIGFTNNCAVASKMKNDGKVNGAFCLEHIGSNQTKEYWNFGRNNRNILFPEEITYGTPTSYNGDSINKGDLPDNDVLSLFSTRENLQVAGQIALYSFLLFDRTLTTAEIEWVKKNMIEGDLVLPSYELDPSLIDAWIFSGLRNEDAPASIVGEKGIELQCNNFAWNEEGSGFKDGELCFDGVDDYLINENMPLLDDFTVIMRRTASGDAGAVVYKGAGRDYNSGKGGAFQLEILYDSGLTIHNRLFGKTVKTQGIGNITLKDEAVSFTPTSIYKGLEYEQNFERVSKEDGPVLKINSPLYGNKCYTIKMKYFALYSKTLTDEEIQSEIEKLEKIWSNRLNNN